MLVPAQQDLVVWRNGVARIRFTLRVDDVVLDLTGCTIRMQVRPRPGDSQILAEASTSGISPVGSYIEIVSAEGGIFEVFISNADLQDISTPTNPNSTFAVVLAYDIVITKPNGDFFPYIRGSMTVNEGVTR